MIIVHLNLMKKGSPDLFVKTKIVKVSLRQLEELLNKAIRMRDDLCCPYTLDVKGQTECAYGDLWRYLAQWKIEVEKINEWVNWWVEDSDKTMRSCKSGKCRMGIDLK